MLAIAAWAHVGHSSQLHHSHLPSFSLCTSRPLRREVCRLSKLPRTDQFQEDLTILCRLAWWESCGYRTQSLPPADSEAEAETEERLGNVGSTELGIHYVLGDVTHPHSTEGDAIIIRCVAMQICTGLYYYRQRGHKYCFGNLCWGLFCWQLRLLGRWRLVYNPGNEIRRTTEAAWTGRLGERFVISYTSYTCEAP